jgi:hypothetical protein
VDAARNNLPIGGSREAPSATKLLGVARTAIQIPEENIVIRALPAVALLGSALAFTSGCSQDASSYEVIMEVTGTASPAGSLVHSIPGSQVETGTPAELPWKRGYVIDKEDIAKGPVTLEVKPAKGAVTCRIVIEKKEAAKVVGKDGEPVKCEATIKKMKV